MKKLALALVCLVSVAFFASCQKTVEHPEPSVAFLLSEGFVGSDVTLPAGDTAWFCVQANANTQTNKLLKSFDFMVMKEGNNIYDTLTQDLNLGTYEYVTGFIFDEVGNYTVAATIIDADGQTATARVNIVVEANLNPTVINWVRRGSTVDETTVAQLASVGLQWTGSHKEVFATIEPLGGTKLYIRPGDDYANLISVNQLSAYYSSFSETTLPSESYRNITTNNSADYNDMLFTLDTIGNFHAILIQHAEIETGSYGTQITITGSMK